MKPSILVDTRVIYCGDNLEVVIEQRDQLIDSLERRLAQRTETETLFTIRWVVM